MRRVGLASMALALAATLASAQGLQRVDPDTQVPSVGVDELSRSLDGEDAPLLLDVRLAEDVEADPVLIQRASWKDPNALEDWGRTIPSGTKLVVYCVRGAWVSQSVTHRLREMGHSVSQLEGGIEAWKRAGRPTRPRPSR